MEVRVKKDTFNIYQMKLSVEGLRNMSRDMDDKLSKLEGMINVMEHRYGELKTRADGDFTELSYNLLPPKVQELIEEDAVWASEYNPTGGVKLGHGCKQLAAPQDWRDVGGRVNRIKYQTGYNLSRRIWVKLIENHPVYNNGVKDGVTHDTS